MIERLCVQADLPKPKIAVANTQMPNAFRDRSLAQVGDGLRDHGDHGAAQPRQSSRA
jgi:hypothetical protein